MTLDSQSYLFSPPDATVVTTKKAIEDYVLQCMCSYLSGFMDGIWDEFHYDDEESEWNKAIEFFQKYVDDAIKELKGDGE